MYEKDEDEVIGSVIVLGPQCAPQFDMLERNFSSSASYERWFSIARNSERLFIDRGSVIRLTE